MRKSKFSEHQIIAILKAVEAGRTIKDVCCEHEISDATYYQWKSKYGGMQASDIKRLRELEDVLNSYGKFRKERTEDLFMPLKGSATQFSIDCGTTRREHLSYISPSTAANPR